MFPTWMLGISGRINWKSSSLTISIINDLWGAFAWVISEAPPKNFWVTRYSLADTRYRSGGGSGGACYQREGCVVHILRSYGYCQWWQCVYQW